MFVVGNIAISGNERTKDFVITREMSLKPGATATKKILDYDQLRIYSLGLFNRVQILVEPVSEGKADLRVVVHERWFLFPFPVFGLKDRDWAKVFYGAGILHNNFRGRNEKLFASVTLGYDPSVALSYRNPFLDAEGAYSIDSRLSYSRIHNRSLLAERTTGSFEKVHYAASVSIGRRFGTRHSVWLGTGFEIVDVDENLPGRTLSQDGTDKYPWLSTGYSFDSRDLREYASSGAFRRASISKIGYPGGEMDIVRYALDIQQFVPFTDDLTLAGRVFTDLIAGGRTPSYNRVFLGYAERIRGHFREIFEGESIVGSSVELHLELLAPRYGTLAFLPREFSVWRFGVTAALFGDAGSVWFRNEPLALNRFVKGYGAGLHFLLPYSIVLRTEYALNEARRGEFIIDLGSSF